MMATEEQVDEMDKGNTSAVFHGCGHKGDGEPTHCPKCYARLEAALRDMGFHAPGECSARLGGGYPRCNACLSVLGPD